MVAILNSAILNLAIFDSAILVFPLKLTHTCQDWFPPFAQKKNFTHTSLPNLEFGAHQGPGPLPHPTHLPHGGVLGSFPHLATFVGPHYLWLKNHQDIVLTH